MLEAAARSSGAFSTASPPTPPPSAAASPKPAPAARAARRALLLSSRPSRSNRSLTFCDLPGQRRDSPRPGPPLSPPPRRSISEGSPRASEQKARPRPAPRRARPGRARRAGASLRERGETAQPAGGKRASHTHTGARWEYRVRGGAVTPPKRRVDGLRLSPLPSAAARRTRHGSASPWSAAGPPVAGSFTRWVRCAPEARPKPAPGWLPSWPAQRPGRYPLCPRRKPWDRPLSTVTNEVLDPGRGPGSKPGRPSSRRR